jgi:hypothetical protein
VDRWGAIKKIQDVNFYPLFATSISKVKTDQPPHSPSITQDDCVAKIAGHAKLFEICMHENLSKFMMVIIKARKRNINFLFFLKIHVLADWPTFLANLNMECYSAFLRGKQVVHRLTNPNWLIR